MLGIGIIPYTFVWAQGEVLATVLFTNDTRGFTENLTYIHRFKEKTDNSLLVNCGNFTKGSALASLSNAKYSSNLMGEAGYDLISLGVDDFSYGYRALKRYADYTGCDMLSGNIEYSSAEIFSENIIKTVNGLKLGFFSLADADCADYIPTARADGYKFSPEIEFAAEQTELLKSKCDKIICLASFADNNKNFTVEKLLYEVSGIDVLICSNLKEEINEKAGDTLVLEAGERLKSLGKIDFLADGEISAEILPEKITDSQGEELETVQGTYRQFGESPAFNTKAQKVLEEFGKTVSSPIALNKSVVYGVHEDLDISLVEETPLGDVFADAMTLAADKFKASDSAYKNHYVVSAVNGTEIVANIPAGEINLQNVFDTQSLAEDVYFYEADSALLFKLMEQSLSKVKYNEKTDFVYNPSEEFLQISGFNVLCDPRKPAGQRIEKLFIVDGDDEIAIEKDDGKKFLLAVNEFLAKGYAGYDDFISLKPVYVGDFLTNYIRTAIASKVSDDYYVSQGTDSRIAYKRIEQLQPNGDAWVTVEGEYEPLAAAEVYVDGVDNLDCSQVDENGEVRITLKTGGHGVTVSGENLYASTVTGLGIKKGTITPIVDYKLYYKTLDDAYKIDEDNYSEEAVKGYFAYLSRAYVETKLTEEGEVVKATQDIFNVWDDFLENPDSFIEKSDEDSEDYEEEIEEQPYPKLEDFEYKGTFTSTVFENTPNTSDSPANTAKKSDNSSAHSSKTGDTVFVLLIVFSAALVIAAITIIVFLYKKKKEGREV